MKDTILYDKLEISPSISDEDLKKEGRKLLLKWHPDKNENKEESSKKFIEIKEILDILTDTEKREIYHQIGIDILDTNYQNTQNTQNIHQNSVNNMFNTDIFAVFIFSVFLVLVVLFFVFSLKYDEYKEKYLITFIKIYLRDATISGEGESLDYDTVAKNIATLTQEEYFFVMNCLFRLIPPNRNIDPPP